MLACVSGCVGVLGKVNVRLRGWRWVEVGVFGLYVGVGGCV